MRITFVTLVITAALVLAKPAAAHHSFSGTYDLERAGNSLRQIVQVSYRSPHSSFFYVAFEDTKGNRQRQAIEAVSAPQLGQAGIHSEHV